MRARGDRKKPCHGERGTSVAIHTPMFFSGTDTWIVTLATRALNDRTEWHMLVTAEKN